MSSNTHPIATATNGLLSHVIAPQTIDPLQSIEQRVEAMRQYRIDVASQLPLEELLDIVARRFDKDQAFRTRVRDISRNRGRPDKAGRRGKLSQAQTYWQVQLQRLSGKSRVEAIDLVARHYGKTAVTVKRQYEDEESRIKKARSVRQETG